jgi:TRAP-type mannitol/chloroaromatic compound transport system permease small subunit
MCKKVVGHGLLLGLIMLIVGNIINYLFMLIPSVKADYYSGIMRSWQDPLMTVFFLYPFILGIVFAGLWNAVKSSFKGKMRGCYFGWWLFFLTTLPGMFITYTSFNLTFLTILGWLVVGLINAKIAGFYLAWAIK